jgi:hypothetical protein
MSKSRGVAVLDPGCGDSRIPVMDHIQGLSRDALIHFTGIDPIREPDRLNETFQRVCEVFEVDLLSTSPSRSRNTRPGLSKSTPCYSSGNLL